jgi:hypothetical protein
MPALKPDLLRLCTDVASEFNDWSFVSDTFRNKALGHTDLIVRPAFVFRGSGINPSCSIQPSICVVNKKSIKLYEDILGAKPLCTSIIEFQTVRNTLRYYPEDFRVIGQIWRNKHGLIDHLGNPIPWQKQWVTLDEARPLLRAMMKDGIDLLERHYSLDSEDSLLRNLPLDPAIVRPHGAEKIFGVMLCLARIVIGDFEFVKEYRNDKFATAYPKHYKELDAIIAAIPILKRRFERTGTVV